MCSEMPRCFSLPARPGRPGLLTTTLRQSDEGESLDVQQRQIVAA